MLMGLLGSGEGVKRIRGIGKCARSATGGGREYNRRGSSEGESGESSSHVVTRCFSRNK